MSKTFSGFSEEDIRKLTVGNLPGEGENDICQNWTVKSLCKLICLDENSRRYIKATRRTDLKNKKPKYLPQTRKPVVEEIENVLAEAKLSEKVETVSEHANVAQNVESRKDNERDIKEIEIKENINSLKPVVLNMTQIEKKVIDLEEFQARQKRIEEQNRRRKELLTKALADR